MAAAGAMNDVRALRLAEIIQDFRNLQHYIAQIRAQPSAEDYYIEGYTLLRQCATEGQAVLNAQFPATSSSPNGDPEAERAHLQYVMLDASARRFQAQRIYLRATAAMRWVNSRNAVLRGQRPSAAHAAQLQQIDNSLRVELSRIGDQRIYDNLRASDIQQGKWIQEDPSLSAILQWLTSRPAGGTAVRRASRTSPSVTRGAGGRRIR